MTQKRKAGSALVLAAMIAAVWLAFRDAYGTGVSSRISRVASTRGWSGGYGRAFPTDPYLWLTRHEILYFAPSIAPGGWDRAGILDTQTGTTQAAPNLICTAGGHIVAASPDGQWVLWDTQTYNSSPPGMAATRRADGKTVRWPHLQTAYSAGFWLPDSRRWVCVAGVPLGKTINGHPISEYRLVIYDVNRPGFRSFAIPGNTGMENILGVTPQGRVIFDDSPDEWGGPAGQAQPPLSFREVSLDGAQPTARAFQVQVPKTPPGESARVSLSPQGDRLLWSYFSSRPNSIAAWIGFWTHHAYAGGRESQDIWTCGLDGSAPRHVGTWSGSRVGFNVRWNPDGRHVSFTKNDALYSCPVP